MFALRLTFLGTGTSSGVPLIGCGCAVCASADPRNRRRRTSAHVEAGRTHLVIDTPPDFREQVLAHGVPRVDAVLITHAHADHIFGLDDLRRFNTMQGASIPVYASAPTLADLRRVFAYVHAEHAAGTYRPELDFTEVDGPFAAGEARVEPLPVEHGNAPTFGFLVEHAGRRLGYVPDCRAMSEAVVRRLAGADVMVLDALRHRPHETHLSLDESAALLGRIGARRSYLVSLGHDLDHAGTERRLPAGVRVAYDGLRVEL